MTESTPETARLTADIVVFSERDHVLHVLLIRRGHPPHKGCLALPGGHVDTGEDTCTAAHRELKEETGLMVAPLTFLGVYAEPGRDPRGRYVDFVYTALILGTPAPTAGDDAEGADWYPVHDVLTGPQPLAFDHARIVHDALRIVMPTATDD